MNKKEKKRKNRKKKKRKTEKKMLNALKPTKKQNKVQMQVPLLQKCLKALIKSPLSPCK